MRLPYSDSSSQYAKAGSAFGETAIGQKYVKAVNQATDKSSDSGTVATHRKRTGLPKALSTAADGNWPKRLEMSSGIQLQAFEHEIQNFIPVFKLKVTQQGFQILEESAAGAQSLTNRLVLLIHQV